MKYCKNDVFSEKCSWGHVMWFCPLIGDFHFAHMIKALFNFSVQLLSSACNYYIIWRETLSNLMHPVPNQTFISLHRIYWQLLSEQVFHILSFKWLSNPITPSTFINWPFTEGIIFSLYQFIYLSIFLSLFPSFYPSIHPSTDLFTLSVDSLITILFDEL